jgi:hypothetical protein
MVAMYFWNVLSRFWSALSGADKINLLIALSTALAAVAAAWSAWLAKRSIRGALEEFRAQTFLGILAYEREVNFSQHMDVVRALGGKPARGLTEEERKSILVVVNFLNHIAHLLRHRYVVPIQLLLLYAPSIAACRANLLGEGQWLKEMRKQTGEPRYYLHFARLCQKETEDLIWANKAKEIVWTNDPYEPSFPAV